MALAVPKEFDALAASDGTVFFKCFRAESWKSRTAGAKQAAEELREPPQAPTPGRVPHVRPSVHGPEMTFFECFYSICHGVIH
jgi:hypothetical protein